MSRRSLSYRHSEPNTLGVSWDKSSSPTLTRINDSVGMVANAGVDDGSVTNDFDTAMIYKDITEVTDSLGNVFVRIPAFHIKIAEVEKIKVEDDDINKGF